MSQNYPFHLQRKLWAFVQYTGAVYCSNLINFWYCNHLCCLITITCFLCFATTTLWNDAFASTQLVSYICMQVAVCIHWLEMEDWNHVMGPCNNILKLIWLTEVGKTVIKVNAAFWLSLPTCLVSQLYIGHISKDYIPFAAVEHFISKWPLHSVLSTVSWVTEEEKILSNSVE